MGRGLVLLGVAVLAVVASPVLGRSLAQRDANCEAWGAIEIIVEGGSCWAKTEAVCSAVAESQSMYAEAFKEWFGDNYYGNVCDKGKAEAAAWAVAEVLASVYTSAFVGVECSYDAQGSACGWTQSNGDAWAIATAEAVASAVADVGADGGKGFCYSYVRAVATAVADVAAKSLEDGCVGGGSSSYKFSESYKTSIQRAFADAFAKATASSCKYGFGSAEATAECEGHASSTVEGETSGQGEGFAQGGQVFSCKQGVKDKCCDRGYTGRICACSTHNGCESGGYQRTSDYVGDDRRTWVAPSGGKCVCI